MRIHGVDERVTMYVRSLLADIYTRPTAWPMSSARRTPKRMPSNRFVVRFGHVNAKERQVSCDDCIASSKNTTRNWHVVAEMHTEREKAQTGMA